MRPASTTCGYFQNSSVLATRDMKLEGGGDAACETALVSCPPDLAVPPWDTGGGTAGSPPGHGTVIVPLLRPSQKFSE